jgi:hypothetical protein
VGDYLRTDKGKETSEKKKGKKNKQGVTNENMFIDII